MPKGERGGKLRKKKLDWLQSLEGRLPDDAVVWDLTGNPGPACVLLSKRHRYHGVVPDGETLAEARRRAPSATFVEGTWTTVEIEPGTATAVIAPPSPKGSSTDIVEFVERAAGWLSSGGYLLVNAGPRDVSAYAPESWLDAADEREPRRAIPTAGALHGAGLEIRDYQFAPARRNRQRTMWLIATPATAPTPRPSAAQKRVDLPLRPEPLIVFVHIPKAAGTTFAEILRNNYPPDSVGRIGNLFKGGGGHDPGVVGQVRDAEKLTLWMHVLTGHLPLGIRDFLPADTRYVTFLREPVDRLLSHYHALVGRKRGSNSGRRPELAPDTPLQEVLADPRRLVFDNLQTRMLCGDPEPLGEVTREMLDQAKENLRAENLVFGLAERYDESLVLVGRRLGLEQLACRSRRVNSSRPRTTTQEVSDLAREFDRFDVELYAYARDLFAERSAEVGDKLALEVQALREARDALGERSRDARRAARAAKKQHTRGGTAQPA